MMELDRRTVIRGGAAILVAPAVSAWSAPTASWYDQAIIIDALGSIEDPHSPNDQLRLSNRAWEEMVQTGVTIMGDTILPVGNPQNPWSIYQRDIALRQKIFDANQDRLLLVRNSADVLKAKREKIFGVVLGTQDTSMVGTDLDRLSQMKTDGVRIVQLTYNNHNLSGDGASVADDAGLSELGRATIERIESEKLLLDLSHGGARTIAEAAGQAKRPLVISHTGARALADHPRNTSDETIKAVADKGGVIGVYFMPFLTLDGRPTGADLLRHVEYIANLAGEDHVGIGTDNGVLPLDRNDLTREDEITRERIRMGLAAPGEAVGVYPVVKAYNSVDRYRRFAVDLQKRGWSTPRLEKLMGANFLRVFREAWEG